MTLGHQEYPVSQPDRRSRSPILMVLFLTFGALLPTANLLAQPMALFVSAGQLHHLDLESAQFSSTLPTELTGSVRALARDSDGTIYALTETCCPTRQHIEAIDPRSGSTQRISSLDQAQAWIGGLAARTRIEKNDSDLLWLAANGGLWSLDLRQGGLETRVPLLIGERQLLSVTTHRSQLFGIVALPSDSHREHWTEPQLIRILDRGTAWETIADLSPMNVDNLASFGVDERGRFWGLEITYASGTPAKIHHTFWRFDLESGGMFSSARVDGSEIGLHFQAFALNGTSPSKTSVPAVDTLGLILFGLLLASIAQFLSWRRQQRLHI